MQYPSDRRAGPSRATITTSPLEAKMPGVLRLSLKVVIADPRMGGITVPIAR